VAVEAESVCGFAQLCVVIRPVNVVAGSAGYAVAIHDALDKIVALHSVLVSCAISEVQEIGLPERAVFELPEVRKMETNVVSDRPIIGFAFNESVAGLPLGMALDAGIVGGDVIHLGWIQNVGARRVSDMLAAGTVAVFTADIPFRDLLGVDVIVDGMAAVAGRSGGSLDVV
jgi:hypothetical protein